MSGKLQDIDNLSLAAVGALVVAGFIFLDPASLSSTLVGAGLLLGAAAVWMFASS